MKMKSKFFLLASLAIGSLCVSCAAGDDDDDGAPVSNNGGVIYSPESGSYESYSGDSMNGSVGGDAGTRDDGGSSSRDGGSSGGEGDPYHNPNNRTSGRLTAGEWNDLDNWKFWTSLLNENKFYDKVEYWKFFPKNLVAVQVVDANNDGIANVPVELMNGNDVEFAAKTDNKGMAYCWINMFDGEGKEYTAEDFALKVDGAISDAGVKITTRASESIDVNVVVSENSKQPEAKADIAFIVDATGSMSDEIEFLISDLEYIIEHATANKKVALRTAALFYRDTDDEYLTKHNDFSDDVSVTQKYVSQQHAEGGGDYPEAVHTALEKSLQNLSWNESARARIAFLILDAPAHHYEDVVASLQKSIKLYAKQGIKIIPVAASGVDKDTEFMLRFFDLATGGTYVFLTDDSGIGGSHIEASVGDYEVEYLNDLLVRLIKKYTE